MVSGLDAGPVQRGGRGHCDRPVLRNHQIRTSAISCETVRSVGRLHPSTVAKYEPTGLLHVLKS